MKTKTANILLAIMAIALIGLIIGFRFEIQRVNNANQKLYDDYNNVPEKRMVLHYFNGDADTIMIQHPEEYCIEGGDVQSRYIHYYDGIAENSKPIASNVRRFEIID